MTKTIDYWHGFQDALDITLSRLKTDKPIDEVKTIIDILDNEAVEQKNMIVEMTLED